MPASCLAVMVVLVSLLSTVSCLLPPSPPPLPPSKTSTSLSGGYDATVGPSPSQPYKLFVSSPPCPASLRAEAALVDLGVPHAVVAVEEPLPDWYVRISGGGATLPSLRRGPGVDAVALEGGREEIEEVIRGWRQAE
eukprot:CAMPEP_0182454302 /NCGR_PEP_ID=MMETSP1319-20130603/1000_1 /TAXON_ID=172717 /ORGANISM="Bolidomonas pacifica, Strain RCC208" /LENGTH=136 /DNA_ID=CAMNT_0024652305 /DNA_START=264 /DNA_END=674 /DNA_ORIENTATION=+